MEAMKTNEMKKLLSKVPEVTIFFWIIKVLCTTVGETASDFLNINLGFGLTGTSVIMGVLLAVVLFFQFKAKKYVPGIYWLTVVLISIFGTLVTDNMTDGMGIPLAASTMAFSIALGITFALWYASEKTLSIHSIFTKRREAFYWLTILFTFALGTATGDLMAESLGFGYLVTGLLIAAAIGLVATARRFRMDPVLAFWLVYIMTRPLGASIGDYLSQLPAYGGLGLGAAITSAIFLLAIMATVLFLAVTKRDLIARTSAKEETVSRPFPVLWQLGAVVCLLVILSGTGYYWSQTKLQNEASAQAGAAGNVSQTSTLGDLSSFAKIEEDTLSLVNSGDLPAAKSRVDELEVAWDNATARLKSINKAKWTEIDNTIDEVLAQLRARQQDAAACRTALNASLAALK
jgi:uncharacterized membrane-anchored protein